MQDQANVLGHQHEPTQRGTGKPKGVHRGLQPRSEHPSRVSSAPRSDGLATCNAGWQCVDGQAVPSVKTIRPIDQANRIK